MKTVSKKLLSLIISFALITGIVQSIGSIPVFAAGVSSVNIGASTLADGKYYTAKSNPTGEALLDEADVKPSGDTPYLYYDNGTLTVNGDISLTSDMPTLIIGGGTLTITGTGRLSLTSNSAPTVTMGENDILSLAGGAGLGVYQFDNDPAILNGSLKTADGYTGNIDVFSQGNSTQALCNMSEINLKTSGYIDIKSAGSPLLMSSLNAVNLEGSSVRLANQGGALILPSSPYSAIPLISINATNDNLELKANIDGPLLNGTDITLAAQGDITVKNPNTYGEKTNSFAVNGNLKVTNAQNVDIQSNGNVPTIQGNVDINASGDVKIANNKSPIAMSGDSIAINSTGGSITVFGSGNNAPVIAANTSAKLEAAGNVLVQRLNDLDCPIPLITASSKTLTSKNGLVIVSGSVDSSITTKGGKTLPAVLGGDITKSGIDLYQNTPTQATLYLAGSGYLLFTPAKDSTPAKLDLCNASMEVQGDDASLIELPKGKTFNMQISGNNTLLAYGQKSTYGISSQKNEQSDVTITSLDNGTLDISAAGNMTYAIGGGDSDIGSLTIGGNAAVTATAKSDAGMAVGTTINGKLTVEPTAKFTAIGDFIDLMVYGEESSVKQAFDGTVLFVNSPISKVYVNGAHNLPGLFKMAYVGTAEINGTTVTCYLNVTSGSTMTIDVNNTLNIKDLAMLKNDGTIVNNGAIVLPAGKTADDIKALKLTGTGAVNIDGKYYSNNGTAMSVVELNSPDGLTLTETPVAAADNKGYTWAKSVENETEVWTLTLNNAYLDGSLILPNKKVVINTTSQSIINYEIDPIDIDGSKQPLNVTFTGTAPLVINSGIEGVTMYDNITVKDGAKVLAKDRISIGESGTGGILNVIGTGTSLNVAAPWNTAVLCDTVNVQGGAALTVSSQDEGSIGIQALGNVNVTGGSTLTAGCDYGIYIIRNMQDDKQKTLLYVDDTSKLVTNADVAPFCIVDATSDISLRKSQNDVIKLPALPDGTKIISADGTDTGWGYAYWSLIPTDGALSVTAGTEGNPTATLVGAVKGSLTFVKAANNNGGNGGNGSNNNSRDDDDDDNTNADNNKALGNANSKPTNTNASKASDNPQTGTAGNAICPVALALILSAAGIVLIRRKFKRV